MQIPRRVREALRRYLPAEATGTVTALAGAWAAYRLTGSPYAAALCGSICEAVGYYVIILAEDVRRAGRTRSGGPARAALRALPGILVEFGPAEILDTLVVRPLLMAAGPVVTGDLVAGTLAGKVAADAVFYAVVVPCNRLRRRLSRRRRRTAATSADSGATTGAGTAQGPVTPYLWMDLDGVERAYRAVRAALPEARVHYAMKCNPDRPVLRRLHAMGASFEIASTAELTNLIAIGVRPRDVLFSNPVKVPGHVRAAWAAGLYRFAVDSDAELDKVAEHAPGAAVYVRLATAPAGSAVSSEGKFGVDGAEAARLMRRAVTLGLRTYGITFHVGSQMTDPTAWASAIERAGALMSVLLDDGIRVQMLDLGGGFPARYDSDHPHLSTYAKHIRVAVDAHLPYPVDLVVEPGRALVAEAGVMVATVIGTAYRGNRRWAHLDVGAFNGLMEALETGNRLRYPVSDSRCGADRVLFALTGPTCDSQDTILHDVELSADLAVGDQVQIHVAGAYTTGYASRFNGFDIPPVRYPDAPPSR